LTDSFELLLFSTDLAMVTRATMAGVDGFIVDWEQRDKARRQAGVDTGIGHDTYEDLCRVRGATAAPVICRLNGVHEGTPEEIEAAIGGGATEILLPMVRTVDEVEAVIDAVGGRCGVGILIETLAGVACATRLARLPLTRVYVGLNDLAIERQSASIFDAVVDGSVESLRALFSIPFGFGGLTLPDQGRPVPCRLLIGEMARLDCRFAFLRRSFHRDVSCGSVEGGLHDIRQAIGNARCRRRSEVDRDQRALRAVVLAAHG
jgi:hypothetical protein